MIKATKEMVQIYYTDLLGSISVTELVNNKQLLTKSKMVLELLNKSKEMQ